MFHVEHLPAGEQAGSPERRSAKADCEAGLLSGGVRTGTAAPPAGGSRTPDRVVNVAALPFDRGSARHFRPRADARFDSVGPFDPPCSGCSVTGGGGIRDGDVRPRRTPTPRSARSPRARAAIRARRNGVLQVAKGPAGTEPRASGSRGSGAISGIDHRRRPPRPRLSAIRRPRRTEAQGFAAGQPRTGNNASVAAVRRPVPCAVAGVAVDAMLAASSRLGCFT